MIDNIHIKNFKAHSDTSIDLSAINLLAGMNGLGKSSIIQALLLLRQTYFKGLLYEGLDLNGELCSIGTVADCIYQFAETDDIDIRLQTNQIDYNWSFAAHINNLSDTFIKKNIGQSSPQIDNKISLFDKSFQYISAFRGGPTNDYRKDTSSVEIRNQISSIEGRCELVAHYLYYFKDNIVKESVIQDKEIDSSLKSQVEYWLRELSPDINIHVSPNESTFNIKYSYSNSKMRTNEFKSSNIGFGVSYVLPIVVATLQACSANPHQSSDKQPSSIIIIENPEAHIHPSGQAKLMELICLAASAGVQFIIETHSDHIINGLLVAIKKNILKETESKVYYFDRDAESHSSKVIPLPVLKNGRIKNAPKGFFDQLDLDMETLMGF